MTDVTRILAEIEAGDVQATEQLLPLVYAELRRLAARHLRREAPGQTLSATALVHEAYMRLVPGPSAGWHGRAHFFGAAAEAMRRILVERARRKRRLKHGGAAQRVPLDPDALAARDSPDELIDIDHALDRLAQIDAQKAELVKLRYFAGLSVEEAAEILGVSRATADRHWAYAKAWLYDAIRKPILDAEVGVRDEGRKPKNL